MDSKSPPILFWWELHCKNRKITEFVRVLLEDPAKGPSKRFFPLSHHLVFTSLCLTPHSQVLYFTFSSYSIWRNTQNKIYCDDKTSPPQKKKKILRPDGKRVKQVITRHLIAMTNFWSTVHVMSSIALWCSLSEQKHICLRGSLGCYVLSEEWKWSTFIFVRVWGFSCVSLWNTEVAVVLASSSYILQQRCVLLNTCDPLRRKSVQGRQTPHG